MNREIYLDRVNYLIKILKKNKNINYDEALKKIIYMEKYKIF